MAAGRHGKGRPVMTWAELYDQECLPKAKLTSLYNKWVPPSFPCGPVLALCETEAEVAYFTNKNAGHVDALIALTPQAACACYLREIPYHKIEDFFDVTAFKMADEPMLALQSRWCDQMDALLMDLYEPFKRFGFRPAGLYFFFLKVMSDMVFRAVFGLAHLVLAARPREVLFFPPQGNSPVPDTLFFGEPVYKQMVLPCARAYDIHALPMQASLDKGRYLHRVNLFLGRALQCAVPRSVIARLRGSKRKNWSMMLPKYGRKGALQLAFGDTAEVGLIGRRAEEHGIKVRSLGEFVEAGSPPSSVSPDLACVLDEGWVRLTSWPLFYEPFSWCGVDLVELVKARLCHWWTKVIPAMWQMFLQARANLQVAPQRAVCISSPFAVEEFAVLQAARSLSIPTVTYQHGGFEGNCEYTTYDRTDLRQSDYRLVYGEGIGSYLKERARRYSEKLAEVVPIGSARLDALRSAPDQSKKVRKHLGIRNGEPCVLYLSSSYQYNWYMARQSYLGVPYFELLLRVMEILRRARHIRFIYKPFPETPKDPIASVMAQGFTNCQAVTDISVPLLIQATDACIIDIPSTGLLEALLTNKQILVFSDSRYIALRREARAMLSKRAILTETVEDYLTQLHRFTCHEGFEPIKNADRSFLRAYGTLSDDGCSAERAVKAIETIILAEGSA